MGRNKRKNKSTTCFLSICVAVEPVGMEDTNVNNVQPLPASAKDLWLQATEINSG